MSYAFIRSLLGLSVLWSLCPSSSFAVDEKLVPSAVRAVQGAVEKLADPMAWQDPDLVQMAGTEVWKKAYLLTKPARINPQFLEQKQRQEFLSLGLRLLEYSVANYDDLDSKPTKEITGALLLLDAFRADWTLDTQIRLQKVIAIIGARKHKLGGGVFTFRSRDENGKQESGGLFKLANSPTQAEITELASKMQNEAKEHGPLAVAWISFVNQNDTRLDPLRIAVVSALLDGYNGIPLPIDESYLTPQVTTFLINKIQRGTPQELATQGRRIRELIGLFAITQHRSRERILTALDQAEKEQVVNERDVSTRRALLETILENILTQTRETKVPLSIHKHIEMLEKFDDEELRSCGQSCLEKMCATLQTTEIGKGFSSPSLLLARRIVSAWPQSEEALFALTFIFSGYSQARLKLGFDLLDQYPMKDIEGPNAATYRNALRTALKNVSKATSRPAFSRAAEKHLLVLDQPEAANGCLQFRRFKKAPGKPTPRKRK